MKRFSAGHDGGGSTKAITRRGFLKGTAAGAAAAAAAQIVPSSAMGLGAAVPPSQRIIVGAIGVGGRGGYDLSVMLGERDVQVVAVCDVQKSRRDAAKRAVDGRYGNEDCRAYRDLRDLIANHPQIEAMLIATGDRWHTPASIMCMQAGMDVFCEKPSTMTVAEGQALVETARRYGRIFQTGTQRLSEANFVFADELARSGRLGRVHTVYAHILPFAMKTTYLPPEPEPDPEIMDWDLWLGPAPWRPYNRGYLGGCGAWLDYYDFGTGVAGWGSHTICQCQAAIGAERTSAIEYEYPGNDRAEGLVARYANGVKLVLSCTMWRGSCGVKYEGTEGWVSVADGYARPDVSSPALLADFQSIVRQYMLRTGRPMHHIRDFLDCVRTRRHCVADEVVAHRSMSTNHAANACMLLRRNVRWDPEKEQFAGDADANRLLSRAMRAPWRV